MFGGSRSKRYWESASFRGFDHDESDYGASEGMGCSRRLRCTLDIFFHEQPGGGYQFDQRRLDQFFLTGWFQRDLRAGR